MFFQGRYHGKGILYRLYGFDVNHGRCFTEEKTIPPNDDDHRLYIKWSTGGNVTIEGHAYVKFQASRHLIVTWEYRCRHNLTMAFAIGSAIHELCESEQLHFNAADYLIIMSAWNTGKKKKRKSSGWQEKREAWIAGKRKKRKFGSFQGWSIPTSFWFWIAGPLALICFLLLSPLSFFYSLPQRRHWYTFPNKSQQK